jgi:hypothetical protein
VAKGKKTGGRQHGSRNKRTAGVEAWARGLVEDPAYQARFKTRLLEAELPAPLEAMVYYYAYGKPNEHVEQSGLKGVVITFLYASKVQESLI